MECIIGVDLGTTSTKAIAFNKKGLILSKSSVYYPVHNPRSTYSEQDPEEIFQAVLNAVKDTWSKIKDSYVLKGISFSSAMHGVMAVDTSGHPLTHCIIWADTRSKEIANTFKNHPSGNEIYQRTGTPIHPMSPLCKIAWIKEHLPEIFSLTYKFISLKEYVFLKLFKKYLVDYSVASATGLFDIYDLTWNKKALEFAGIEESKLSEPVTGTHQESNPDVVYQNYMDIPAGVPFIIGANDGCLSNLGANAISTGRAALTIGTSGAIRIGSDKPIADDKCRIFNYLLNEKKYIIGGPVNNGGIVLQWFLENIGRNQSHEAFEGKVTDFSKDLQNAEQIKAGADGLIFLPYILGERAPHWDAESRGVFFGLNINHSRAHMIKAIQEGVIYGMFSIAEALESTSEKIEAIYANGGFARSNAWVQILADVFNKKVYVSESVESSAWGAALMGMHSVGWISQLDDQACFTETLKEFKPNIENHLVYQKYYHLFGRLYEKLKEEFHLLNALQG